MLLCRQQGPCGAQATTCRAQAASATKTAEIRGERLYVGMAAIACALQLKNYLKYYLKSLALARVTYYD